ncbi:unnamed protein product, partial [Amoebophrya sp. A120]
TSGVEAGSASLVYEGELPGRSASSTNDTSLSFFEETTSTNKSRRSTAKQNQRMRSSFSFSSRQTARAESTPLPLASPLSVYLKKNRIIQNKTAQDLEILFPEPKVIQAKVLPAHASSFSMR